MHTVIVRILRVATDWLMAPAVESEPPCTNCPRRSVCEAEKSWVRNEADLEREDLISRAAARKYVVGNTIPPSARRGPDA